MKLKENQCIAIGIELEIIYSYQKCQEVILIIKIASCENIFLFSSICTYHYQVKKILSENKTKTNSVLVSNLNKVGQLWHSDIKKNSSPHFKGKLKIENSNFLQFLNLMIKD